MNSPSASRGRNAKKTQVAALKMLSRLPCLDAKSADFEVPPLAVFLSSGLEME